MEQELWADNFPKYFPIFQQLRAKCVALSACHAETHFCKISAAVYLEKRYIRTKQLCTCKTSSCVQGVENGTTNGDAVYFCSSLRESDGFIMAKRGRRGKGEGNIYYREEEGRWMGSFYTEDGQRKYVYDKTQQGAMAKLRAAQREDERGMLVAEPEQTLSVYRPQWLEKVHRSKIRLSTYTRYSILLKKHILPALGHIKVQKLTATHLQALYNRKLEEGLSAGVVRLLHAVLHKALRNALRIGLVSRNVCDLVDAPQPAQSEGQTLTTEQVHRLLEVAKGHDLEAIVTVAIMTGMRLGELLSFRWQDTDLGKRNRQNLGTVALL